MVPRAASSQLIDDVKCRTQHNHEGVVVGQTKQPKCNDAPPLGLGEGWGAGGWGRGHHLWDWAHPLGSPSKSSERSSYTRDQLRARGPRHQVSPAYLVHVPSMLQQLVPPHHSMHTGDCRSPATALSDLQNHTYPRHNRMWWQKLLKHCSYVHYAYGSRSGLLQSPCDCMLGSGCG